MNKVLTEQYSQFKISSKVQENISLLNNSKTFTITTGHQLNLFTGPLYFIYKIVTVIKTCQELKSKFQEYNFVPVYWMASEDHDVAEINHFCLFSKNYNWETKQQGAVGRFKTEGIENIFKEISEKLPLFEKAYLEHHSLSEATRYLVNELFGEFGLLILDADNKELKSQFSSVIKDELINQVSYKNISADSGKLKELGYDQQINPREINLFYLGSNMRERIISSEGDYKLSGSELEFSEKEILELVEKKPEVFSPNVALRPLYQQMILPNLAYCGGPAEISYWLQLKTLFDHYKISYPILLPRLSALILSKNVSEKLDKLGMTMEDIFLKDHLVKEKIVSKVSSVNFEIDEESRIIGEVLDKIKETAKKIDPTMEGYVAGEKQKFLKQLEQIEKRLKKAEESKHLDLLNQFENIKPKLFPEDQMQERIVNFFKLLHKRSFFYKEAG